MSLINLQIITPEKVILEQNNILQITLPTESGEITILPNHIPLVSLLKPGEVRVKSQDGEMILTCSDGYIEFRDNNLRVLADTAERLEELEEKKIEEARRRAEELLKQKQKEDVDYARLVAGLNREMVRLKVLRKYRGHQPHITPTQPERPEVDTGNF